MNNSSALVAALTIITGLTAFTPSMIYGQQAQNNTATTQNSTATTQSFGGPPTGPLTAVQACL